MSKPICYCGSSSHPDSNSKIYNGKEYGNGRIWLCDRFPECRGSVGTHPDGRPLGTICDPETKALRIQVHDLIDPLWQNQDRSKNKARGSVYGWMRRITGIKDYHTGSLTKEQALLAIEAIKREPYELRPVAGVRDPSPNKELFKETE